MPHPTHYETLGVAEGAAEQDIVHAYRILVRKHHPDIAGPSGAALTASLNHAYDVLSDPSARREYDRGRLPAASVPGWVEPPSDRSFATPVPSKPGPGPSRREWRNAFPVGSRLLFVLFGVGLAVVAMSFALIAFFGAVEVAAFLAVLGVLGCAVKAKGRFLPWLFLPFVFSAAGAFLPVDVSALGSPVFLGLNAAGWLLSAVSLARFWALRRLHAEANQWAVLSGIAAAEGNSLQWVAAVDGGDALLENAASGERRTIRVWGDVVAGTWVALNSASFPVASAPGSAFKSSEKVRAAAERRDRRAANRNVL